MTAVVFELHSSHPSMMKVCQTELLDHNGRCNSRIRDIYSNAVTCQLLSINTRLLLYVMRLFDVSQKMAICSIYTSEKFHWTVKSMISFALVENSSGIFRTSSHILKTHLSVMRCEPPFAFALTVSFDSALSWDVFWHWWGLCPSYKPKHLPILVWSMRIYLSENFTLCLLYHKKWWDTFPCFRSNFRCKF